MSVNGKLQFHLLTAWQKSNHTLVFDNLLSNANFFSTYLTDSDFLILKAMRFLFDTQCRPELKRGEINTASIIIKVSKF